jgi:carboxymethylenebutenolidase
MSGLAYYVGPDLPGQPLLLLHSWHGLSSEAKRLADLLADEGCTVLVPDLLDGALAMTEREGKMALDGADPNRLVNATLGGLDVLRRSAPGPVDLLGLGMGGSLALWLSVRRPELVRSVVSFYGLQTIDFSGAKARYQLHLAGEDPWVTADDAAFMEATMGMEGLKVERFDYPAARHGFLESDFEGESGQLAWSRTLEFLRPG